MKTIALFNNKGGVGKTTLCFHLAHMISRMDRRVVAVDLDPQANLTAYFLGIEEIEALWEGSAPATVWHCLSPALEGSELLDPELYEVSPRLSLLPGHVDLSRSEDTFANAWLQRSADMPGLYNKVTALLGVLIARSARAAEADVALVDVGPNLGAITRAALLAADHVLIPLTADIFSLQGLRNLGPKLREWRRIWSARPRAQKGDWPSGAMAPAGYILLQHAVRKGRPTKALQVMLERVPAVYHEAVLAGNGDCASDPAADRNCLGEVKNYQSLVPFSQDANRPVFDLRAGDGAIGAHQAYVERARDNFAELARAVIERCGL